MSIQGWNWEIPMQVHVATQAACSPVPVPQSKSPQLPSRGETRCVAVLIGQRQPPWLSQNMVFGVWIQGLSTINIGTFRRMGAYQS